MEQDPKAPRDFLSSLRVGVRSLLARKLKSEEVTLTAEEQMNKEIKLYASGHTATE